MTWSGGQTGRALASMTFSSPWGQGPGVDAAASGELVLEPDLEDVPAQRWPAFTPAALELGVRAVFAVPLQIGVIRLGVVLAHRDAPGMDERRGPHGLAYLRRRCD